MGAPESEPRPVSRLTRIATLIVVIAPFAGLVAAIALLWGIGFSWVHLWLLLGMYLFTAIGITVGYHRYFTHKSFETNVAVRAVLGVLGSMAAEGPILKWAAMHRCHHQHSDTEADPHSPHCHGEGVIAMLRGFWRAHVGWFFEPEPVNLGRYVPDLHADTVTRRVSNTFVFWVVLGLVVSAVLGGLLTQSWLGVLLGFIWGGLARIFLVHHITWSVNSVCHIWGTRPFRSHDHSRNNLIFGILALGEGWHNNHHAFPTSARHGLRWWEIDTSYLIIRGLEAVGLARRVRVPSHETIVAKLNR